MAIDLNADVGESLGLWRLGEDEALIPLVTSVNVACGFHAGDPSTMARTVDLAVAAHVAIGAHPGYPDLVGFGRREVALGAEEVEAAVRYQIGALAAFTRAAGAELRHVKPHGALYHRAAGDPAVAEAVARAARAWSRDLVVVGQAGSIGLDAAAALGVPVLAEAFADRRYAGDGTLADRSRPDAMLDDPASVADQAVSIATGRGVIADDGAVLEVAAGTLCVHGDRTGAASRAAAVRAALATAGVEVRSAS